MSQFTTSMFASIKDALQKDTSKSSGFGNIMRFEKGNSYVVRLLPNIADPAKTFFHYYAHGWESFATGQYMSLVSPQTFGERDPIAEFRYKTNRSGSIEEKNKAKAISRVEKWLVNAYVVDDPVNPENNGKVMIARYGKQLHNVIVEAISGEDASELGEKIFDLSDSGCSLRIKVEDQGGYPTYVSSKFLMPGPVPGITAETTDDILKTAHVLDEVFNIKSYSELQEALNEHYHVIDSASEAPEASAPTRDPDLDEEVSFESSTSTNETVQSPPQESSQEESLDDDKIQELLAGLDD